MIASCPSCSTSYRYAAASGSGSIVGLCSGCGERFPLATVPRSYLVLPAVPAIGAARRGMVESEPPRKRPGVPLAEPAATAEQVGRSGPGAALRLLAATLPAAALGCAAYATIDRVPTDPVRWIASGAIAGLLIGWISIRWMARRH